MRFMTSVVRLALCGAMLGLTACSHVGSVGGGDAGTDADTDTDTDTDADTEIDTEIGPAVSCPVFVGGSLGEYADHNGSSWDLAYPTVQDGLDGAASLVSDVDGGVAECEVWVAVATYEPTADTSGDTDPSDPRTKTFLLSAGVALYGGFAGTEAALEERDIVANETILSGDLGNVGDDGDNAYHVVTGADFALIDGFTITAGRADGEYPNDSGGGMYNEESSPTVTSCTFSGNDGGGMTNEGGSSPTVTGCSFSGNASPLVGGGMLNQFSSPLVTGCTFSGNSAEDWGGGMFNLQSSTTVTNCVFSGNSAEAGGGMANLASYSTGEPTVTNCTFSGNSADVGGGMYNDGNSSPTVTNCTFSGNSADVFGGGMYNSQSYPTVTNCILWGDTGGEIEDDDDSPNVTQSDVQGGCEGDSNIDADPLFVDAESGDLRLSTGSPCIDAGWWSSYLPDDVADLDDDDDTDEPIPYDLDGNPRIVDGDADGEPVVDMGAYEYQP